MSIADKLEAARKAALASGGALPAASPAPASAMRTGMQNSLEGAKATTAEAARISALKKEDILPKKTKASQVMFYSPRDHFNTVFAAVGKETKRISFVSHHFITEDADVIGYLRENATHFNIREVNVAIVEKDPPAPSMPMAATKAEYPLPALAGFTPAELRAAADAMEVREKTDNQLKFAADIELADKLAKEEADRKSEEADRAAALAAEAAIADDTTLTAAEKLERAKVIREEAAAEKAEKERLARLAAANAKKA